MALPQYRDEVLVTLTSLDPPSSFPFPDRRFFLSREKPTMDIGRTSRRNSSLEAARNNAWFDSAVISRDHAQLKLDAERQKVYIKDVGSLHGTFKNGHRLPRYSSAVLSSGDNIRFGINIERGSNEFPPCVMVASLRFGSIDPEDRPKVFRVPDDSDVEDSNSDDEDESVRDSSEILRKVNIRPATSISSPSNYSPRYSPIDLTSNDQYPTSNVREDKGHANELDSLDKSTAASSSSPTKPIDYSDFSPPAMPASSGWLLGSEDQDMEIHLSESTDMDTDSSVDNESTAPSVSAELHTSILSANLEDTDSEDDEFDGKEVFEDYIPDTFSQPSAQEETLVNPSAAFGLITDANPCFPTICADDHTPSQEAAAHIVQGEASKAPCAVVGGMGYILNYPTSPVEHQQMSPDQNRWGVSAQASMRLPSISEAVSSSQPPPLKSQVDPKTLAGGLGAKTGKHEYFAAREENRYHVMGSYPAQNESNFPRSGLESATHTLAVEYANAEPTKTNVVDDFQEPETLDASGAKFLHSPIDDLQVDHMHDEPLLDETSAFQFEMSKRSTSDSRIEVSLDETPKNAGKRTRMGIDDMLQAPNETATETVSAPDPAQTPKKRKAEDISELSPGEKEAKGQKKMEARASFLGVSSAAAKRRRAARMKAKAAPEPGNDAPRKRLRHVAEAFGYVALGGVAVMTALIATAPTL